PAAADHNRFSSPLARQRHLGPGRLRCLTTVDRLLQMRAVLTDRQQQLDDLTWVRSGRRQRRCDIHVAMYIPDTVAADGAIGSQYQARIPGTDPHERRRDT